MENLSKRCKFACIELLHPMLSTILIYCEDSEIVTTYCVVSQAWKRVSQSTDLWESISKIKWSKWLAGELRQFPFMFMKGASSEEIKFKEKELGCQLRFDIRELLKIYSGVNFPFPLFQMFHENAAVFLQKITSWSRWEKACYDDFGCSFLALFKPEYHKNHPEVFCEYILIGQRYAFCCSGIHKTYILLKVSSWKVYRFQICSTRPFLFLNTFEAWFRKGAEFLSKFSNISELQLGPTNQTSKYMSVGQKLLFDYEFWLETGQKNIEMNIHWEQVKKDFCNACWSSATLSILFETQCK